MSFWFTQRYGTQPEIEEFFHRTTPATNPAAVDIPVNEIFDHLQTWKQHRLPLPQILAQARWFVLWHHPSNEATPYGFAVLEESANAIYGYSLWARQSGRIQPIATATDKTTLDDYLQAERCELTTEAGHVRSFLRNVARQLPAFS
ncbi:hypothetical protein GCM10027299_08490 [Larkinella ripae]